MYTEASCLFSTGVYSTAKMPESEIRTAMKVDLKKPAAEQPGLHVKLDSLHFPFTLSVG